ncbi:MAG: 2Fe-2S iron-sulfur cluster-binding protein [Pseudooceanicola sp.]
MPTATYILPDGTERILELRAGQSLMEGAVRNGIVEILGECGGSAMCATCHVFVESVPGNLTEMSADEDAMLDETATDRTDASRLSCQIRMSDAIDGIVVRVPEEM